MKYTKGSLVKLKKPQEEREWNSEMEKHIGKTVRIIKYGNCEGYGNYVIVDIEDNREWLWFENMFEIILETYEIY